MSKQSNRTHKRNNANNKASSTGIETPEVETQEVETPEVETDGNEVKTDTVEQVPVDNEGVEEQETNESGEENSGNDEGDTGDVETKPTVTEVINDGEGEGKPQVDVEDVTIVKVRRALEIYRSGMMSGSASVRVQQTYSRTMLGLIKNIINPVVAEVVLEDIIKFYRDNAEDFTSGYNMYRYVGDWNNDPKGLDKFTAMQMAFSVIAGNKEHVDNTGGIDVTNLIPMLELEGAFASALIDYKNKK